MSVRTCPAPDLKKVTEGKKPSPPVVAEGAPLPTPRLAGGLNLPTSELSQTLLSRSRWWTRLACSPSHDGRALVIYKGPQIAIDQKDPTVALGTAPVDLIEIRRGGRTVVVPVELAGGNREVRWSTESRYVSLFAKVEGRMRLIAFDTEEMAGTPAPIVLWTPPHENEVLFAQEWMPGGEGLSVLTRFYEGSEGFCAIYDVPFAKGKPGDSRQVLRMRGHLDWEAMPVSRFEDGDGPSKEPWKRFYGTYDGLWISDRFGTERKRVAGIAARTLANIDWNPQPDKLQGALFYPRTVNSTTGDVFKGLHFVELLPDGEVRRMHLYEQGDIHTLWYSPKGTYIAWATPEAVYIVSSADPTQLLEIGPPTPEAARKARRTTRQRPGQGYLQPPGISGCYWKRDESQLLFTANDRVYVYVLATGDVYEVTRVETRNPGFVADPRWLDDEQTIVFTYFEDVGYERLLVRNRPMFEIPLKDGCETLKKPR